MMNYKELKKQMAESLASLYIFYGDEVFLESYMTERLIKQAVDSDFAEFNHLVLTGETLTPDAVSRLRMPHFFPQKAAIKNPIRDFFQTFPTM